MGQSPQDIPKPSFYKPPVVHIGDGIVVSEVGFVCVAVWRKKPTVQRFEMQRVALREAVKKNPGRSAFLCVVEAGTEPPDDDIRKASSEMITELGAGLSAVATVVEGTGFKAAISRTVLSGIGLLVRTPSPVKYFESASSAGVWLTGFVPLGNLTRFVEQVEVIRGALGHR